MYCLELLLKRLMILLQICKINLFLFFFLFLLVLVNLLYLLVHMKLTIIIENTKSY